MPIPDDTPLLAPLLADGRPLLTLGTLGLLASGGFAIFLAAAGQFLPHDLQFLGTTAATLCGWSGGSVARFMVHDRVAFGGVLIALSVLYLWLIHFPLRAGRPWAWWTLLLSTAAGFASFGTYLGTGYLDTWHGLASLALLPCFAAGLALSWRTLARPRGIATLLLPGQPDLPPGQLLLVAVGLALAFAGLTIAAVGMTVVFVQQDLQYLRTTPAALTAFNPRLVPLIAHDRARFGSGVLNVGFLLAATAWCGPPARHRWQAVAVAGSIGFGTAIGVHPAVGYNNPVHLAPAVVGAAVLAVSLFLTRPSKRPAGIGTTPTRA